MAGLCPSSQEVDTLSQVEPWWWSWGSRCPCGPHRAKPPPAPDWQTCPCPGRSAPLSECLEHKSLRQLRGTVSATNAYSAFVKLKSKANAVWVHPGMRGGNLCWAVSLPRMERRWPSSVCRMTLLISCTDFPRNCSQAYPKSSLSVITFTWKVEEELVS